jgi:hypothetical protein
MAHQACSAGVAVIVYIVVRKFILKNREATTIDSVYSTSEDARLRVVNLAKKAAFHNLRFHVVKKQLKGSSCD